MQHPEFEEAPARLPDPIRVPGLDAKSRLGRSDSGKAAARACRSSSWTAIGHRRRRETCRGRDEAREREARGGFAHGRGRVRRAW